MKHILAKLEKYDLNKRALTPDDALLICDAEKIKVFIESMLWPGLYMVRKKRPGIFIDAALSGVDKQIVLWHEIGHHWLHAPMTCFYQPYSEDKFEYEAQSIAALALMPLPLITSVTLLEIQEEFGYPAEFMWFRKEIYERYKI